MKKYLLGLVAFVIAIGASAFVSANHAVKSTNTTVYYWYKVDASGNIDAGSQAYGGEQLDPEDAESNLPCTAGTHSDCVRGFVNQITTFPSSATGDTPPLKKN